jgi:hypothetical protein
MCKGKETWRTRSEGFGTRKEFGNINNLGLKQAFLGKSQVLQFPPPQSSNSEAAEKENSPG